VSPGHIVVSWGSDTPSTKKRSEIFAAPVTISTH
jgi:hypothetical protein